MLEEVRRGERVGCRSGGKVVLELVERSLKLRREGKRRGRGGC